MCKSRWDYNSAIEESKKYTTRTQFQKGSKRAYDVSRINRWLDDMVWLKPKSLYGENAQKADIVYAYEFFDLKSVYVGRTIDIKRRDWEHRHGKHTLKTGEIRIDNDAVYNFGVKNNIEIPNPKILETNITIIEGQILENVWLEKYKENGWVILNKSKCGACSSSLGGLNNRKWNKRNVFNEAKKFKSRGDFRKISSCAYEVARKNKWLDEMTWFVPQIKESGYWTKEKCIEEAKKYKSRGEFYQKGSSAYIYSKKNKWLDEMTWLSSNRNKWDKDKIIEEAKKYNSRSDFSDKNRSAYEYARRNKLLDLLYPKNKI